ncbi:UNKNOWN [Stylonychia lemnae]|uniref:Exoribonuclease phosphorolytic domain-containing protein n=1 Tax=Stylonychia lemnae TaxID=5949 RepID=A0A078AYQ3_STYLE|nr:UNKNOWN [Stylonychia lemnae]|eukprot:CDW85893.1 UNKNOWN [Stylonychia lemnae]
MLELRHDNDQSTLRMNGRKLLELRDIKCQLDVMKNTSGSALFEIGNTKVVAFLQAQTLGVNQLNRGILNVNFFVTNFSAIEHRADIKKDIKMKEFTRMIKSVFEQVILLDLYPRSQLDLQVFVLEADGGYRSAAFNAVSLALMDGGIAMKDFVVATTAGLLGNVGVIDLIYQEEKKQNCEFVLVHLQKAQKIAYVNLNCNKIRLSDFEKLMSISVDSCDKIANEMKTAIRAKLVKNINSFYFK